MHIPAFYIRTILLVFVVLSAQAQHQKLHQAKLGLPDDNAALRYMRAYAALHQTKVMSSSVAPTLQHYATVPLDAFATELVTAARGALLELHHGARLPHCAWAVSAEDGIIADTSHRGVARELIAVAGLRARLRFRDGQLADATDDLLDAIALARHLTFDGSLASAMMGNYFEQGPIELLAQSLPRLSPAILQQVIARYDALPSSAKMAEVLLSHEKVTRTILLTLLQDKPEKGQLIERLTTLYAFKEGGAEEFLTACGGTANSLRQKIVQLRPRYIKWSGWFRLSPDEFEKKYQAETEELAKTNPVFELLTPSISKMRWNEAYRQTQQALFRAGAAVQLNGKRALSKNLDPYNDQEFQYALTSTGFRLESQLKKDGKSLAINIGTEAEK